jgi:arylsulfatase A-like enzyme
MSGFIKISVYKNKENSFMFATIRALLLITSVITCGNVRAQSEIAEGTRVKNTEPDKTSAKITNAEKEQRPNVLMILVDDLNDYQGVFGGHPQAKTPNIDKLAKSGIRFTNAQTNVPVCQPSRNSLFTGVYPHDSGDYNWTAQAKQKVLKHNKTLMELFRENGYYTLGTGKLMHRGNAKRWNEWGRPIGHNYGPTYFDGKNKTAVPSVPSPYREIGAIDGSYGRLSDGGYSSGKKGTKGWMNGWNKSMMRYVNDNDRDLLPDEHHAKWASEKLTELAQAAHTTSDKVAVKQKQPFFMGVGLVRPHTPLYAPDRFFDMFPLDEIKLAPWMKGDNADTYFKDNFPAEIKGLRYYKTLLASYDNDHEIAIKHFLQAYLACVAFMDEQVGKIIDTLDSHAELKNNTMVVFTADHGWQMGEKSYLFKNSPWEESARIPLIIRQPNNKNNGSEAEHPVSLIDIYPTFVDYAQLTGDHRKNSKGGKLGGYSLRAFLENPDSKQWQGPNGALTVIGNYHQVTKIDAVEKQNYSYRTKDWRYIRYSGGQEELYNHNKDPYEHTNLAGKTAHQKIKQQLLAEINAIIGLEI